MNESRDLALIDKARAALAEARTIEEAKDLRDKASALAYYAARKGGAEEAERYANEIRLRAERRIGEIAAEMEKAPRGGPGGTKRATKAPLPKSKTAALEAAGIPKEDASRFERIAAIPAERFEEEVRNPEATTRSMARIGGEYRRDGQVPSGPEPAPVARPPVSDRMVERRAQMFRVAVEQVLRKYLAKWPSGTSAAPLARVLVEISNTVKELQS